MSYMSSVLEICQNMQLRTNRLYLLEHMLQLNIRWRITKSVNKLFKLLKEWNSTCRYGINITSDKCKIRFLSFGTQSSIQASGPESLSSSNPTRNLCVQYSKKLRNIIENENHICNFYCIRYVRYKLLAMMSPRIIITNSYIYLQILSIKEYLQMLSIKELNLSTQTKTRISMSRRGPLCLHFQSMTTQFLLLKVPPRRQ